MIRCRARRRAGAWGVLLPVGIVFVVLGLQLATVRDGHDWGGDFSLYLSYLLADRVVFDLGGGIPSPLRGWVVVGLYNV